MGKRILFIDRDGVILQEPPSDYQVDSTEKTSFVKGVITALSKIAADFDYYRVMVTNQDGLGTASYPTETFEPYQNLMLRTLEGEGFVFDEIHVDKTLALENKPTRKPGTSLLTHFFESEKYDLANSFVIGDRWSDIQLAKNLGAKAIYIKGLHELTVEQENDLRSTIVLETDNWNDIYTFLKLGLRKVVHERNTNETNFKKV
jgi:imidazoleglycerol-phosphate dehydratase/histidinol-phosphatase